MPLNNANFHGRKLLLALVAGTACPCLAHLTLTASATQLIEGSSCLLSVSESGQEGFPTRDRPPLAWAFEVRDAGDAARVGTCESKEGNGPEFFLTTEAWGRFAHAALKVTPCHEGFRFTAPQVLGPTDLVVQVKGHRRDGTEAGAEITLRILPVVSLRASKTDLPAGTLFHLTPARADGEAASWQWHVEIPGPGPFVVRPVAGRTGRFTGVDPTGAALPDTEFGIEETKGGDVFFTAPKVTLPTGMLIQARDTAHGNRGAEVRLTVVPEDLGPDPLTIECLLPAVLGPGWSLEQGPSLEPFLDFAESKDGPEAIRSLCYVDDEAMRPFHGTWLGVAPSGLWSFPPHGAPTLVAADPWITCVAAPPAGSVEGHPAHVAYADADGRIWVLDPGSPLRLLEDRAAPFEATVEGLAIARDGTFLVAEWVNEYGRRIRAISGDGRFSTILAGPAVGWTESSARYLPMDDGRRSHARFGMVQAFALDPVAGCVYLIDHGFLRRVTLDGHVATWRGPGQWGGFHVEINQHGHCLGDAAWRDFQQVTGLAVLGGKLLLSRAGLDTLVLLDLDTGARRGLVPSAGVGPSRMGPLADFSPSLARERRAAMRRPNALGLSPDGTCLVALNTEADRKLAQLDLSCLAGAPAPRIDYPAGPVAAGAKVTFTWRDPSGAAPPLDWSASAGILRILANDRVELEVPAGPSRLLAVTARPKRDAGAGAPAGPITVPVWVHSDGEPSACSSCVIL